MADRVRSRHLNHPFTVGGQSHRRTEAGGRGTCLLLVHPPEIGCAVVDEDVGADLSAGVEGDLEEPLCTIPIPDVLQALEARLPRRERKRGRKGEREGGRGEGERRGREEERKRGIETEIERE